MHGTCQHEVKKRFPAGASKCLHADTSSKHPPSNWKLRHIGEGQDSCLRRHLNFRSLSEPDLSLWWTVVKADLSHSVFIFCLVVPPVSQVFRLSQVKFVYSLLFVISIKGKRSSIQQVMGPITCWFGGGDLLQIKD